MLRRAWYFVVFVSFKMNFSDSVDGYWCKQTNDGKNRALPAALSLFPSSGHQASRPGEAIQQKDLRQSRVFFACFPSLFWL